MEPLPGEGGHLDAQRTLLGAALRVLEEEAQGLLVVRQGLRGLGLVSRLAPPPRRGTLRPLVLRAASAAPAARATGPRAEAAARRREGAERDAGQRAY